MKNIISILLILLIQTSCSTDKSNSSDNHKESHDNQQEIVKLPMEKLKALNLHIDKIQKQTIYQTITVTGQLSIPPQNSANITTMIGGNIQEISVLEGDKVKRGEVLATITHPKIIAMQSEYLQDIETLNLYKAELERQKKLYKDKATSGKKLLEAQTAYNKLKAKIKATEAQLVQIHVDIDKLKKGEIMKTIPIISPINGFVEKINARIGQYIPEQELIISVLNNKHLHADLLVYENDAQKVKKGQKVIFHTLSSPPQEDIQATIFSVGKAFEDNPKAIHVHAEMNDETSAKGLIAGMYIEGKIVIDSLKQYALPKNAVIKEQKNYYGFSVIQENNQWIFTKQLLPEARPIGDFIVFNADTTKLYLHNNAYYIVSELQKGELEHE